MYFTPYFSSIFTFNTMVIQIFEGWSKIIFSFLLYPPIFMRPNSVTYLLCLFLILGYFKK